MSADKCETKKSKSSSRKTALKPLKTANTRSKRAKSAQYGKSAIGCTIPNDNEEVKTPTSIISAVPADKGVAKRAILPANILLP